MVRTRLRWQFLVAGFLLLLLAARVALPTLVAQTLERVLSDALAVEFVAGNVDLDVLEGQLIVEDVSMRVAGAEDELAHAVSIAIDADWGALIEGELRAERIAIEGPVLYFDVAANGDFNWSAVGSRADAAVDSSEAADAGGGGTFRVTSDVVDVGAGTIEFVDRRPDGLPELSVALTELRLEGPEIARAEPGDGVRWALGRAEAVGWELGATPRGYERLDFEMHAVAGPELEDGTLPLDLSLSRAGGVALTLRGALRQAPFGFDLAAEWKGLRSQAVAPLLLRGVDVERGTASGNLRMKLDLAEGSKRGLSVTGTVAHEDLAVHVGEPVPLDLAVEQFSGEIDEILIPISDGEAQAPPIQVAWKNIDLLKAEIELRPAPDDAEAPTAEAEAEEAPVAESAAETAAEPSALPSSETEAGPAPLELRIGKLAVIQSRLAWHVRALGKDGDQELSGVRIDATGVQWPPGSAEHAKLTVGSLGAKPLRIEGPARADGAELKVRGKGIKLVPWNPLIKHYSEYSVTGGSVSLKSDFALANGRYEAPTTITLHRIKVTTDGDGFQQTFGIPLSAAVTLLSDPSGDIDLEIPISGTTGAEGELQLGVSIVDAVREGITNALTSVLTSPLGLAGSLLAKGHDLAFLRIGEAGFEAGAVTLDEAARAELDRAAAFVAKSPEAKLSLAAEIVASDLDALGAGGRRANVFRALVRGGAVLFGGDGGSDLDAGTYTLALDLAKARLAAATEHVVAAGVLAPERVIHIEWDEKVAGGSPRVVLRIDMSPDEDE